MSGLEDKTAAILEMQRLGRSEHEIAETLGVSMQKVGHVKQTSERIAAINTAISEGVTSLEEYCSRTNLAANGLRKLVKKNKLSLPVNLKPFRYRPELDILIDQGLPITMIGINAGLTREAARIYINDSGQYDYWRAKRREFEKKTKEEHCEREDLYGRLLYALESRIQELTRKESWPLQMALKYKNSIKKTDKRAITLEVLVRLFKHYEEAETSGRKIGLWELGKLVGFVGSHVGRIFRSVGLSPMHGNINVPRYSQEKKVAIERIYQLGMDSADIGYFIGVPEHFPHRYLHKKYIVSDAKLHFFRVGRYVLNYKLASEIYLARDLGYTPNDTAQLLGTNEAVVKFAMDNEGIIGQKIMKALRIVYNQPDYNQPYKTAA